MAFHHFSIVVFRCLRYAYFGLTPFCVRDPIGGKGEWDFWYISLFQLSFIGYMLLFIYSFDIIFKFLAFRLKSGILPYAAEIILLSPGTCSCFVNKIQLAS